ncbi:MAG: GNAT family N-acetyltransferase [Candidatus Thiodiazotropha sp.]
MPVKIADNETDLHACFRIMQHLRPELDQQGFAQTVRRLNHHGYRLALLETAQGAVAVAGFRISESLAWKRYLYVDDLVTLPEARSRGYGAQLLEWLEQYAAETGCEQIHLDCGIQREEAHRFYRRSGLQATAFHFHKPLHPR